LVAPVVVLSSAPLPGTPALVDDPAEVVRDQAKVVFLCAGLAPENLVTFTTALAASGHPGVVLLDSAKASPYTKAFLAAFKPERVELIGSFPEGRGEVERRLELRTARAMDWAAGPLQALWRGLFPKA